MRGPARALALLATAVFLLLATPFLVLTTLYLLSGIVAPIPGLAVLLVYCILVVGLIAFWTRRSKGGEGAPVDRGGRLVAKRLMQGITLLATIVFLSLSVPFIVLTASSRPTQARLDGPALLVIFVYGIAIVALVMFWIRQISRRRL
jgi:hypothetical protein